MARAMTTGLRRSDLGLAFILGLCGPWIVGWLVSYTFGAHLYFTQFFVSLLHERYSWTPETVRPFGNVLYAVVSSLTYGAVLGLPLGLFLKQSPFLSWLAFVVAYLLAELGQGLDSEFGVGLVLFDMQFPPFLFMLLAVLGFAWLGQRLRHIYAPPLSAGA